MDLINIQPLTKVSSSTSLATTDNPLASSKFVKELEVPTKPMSWYKSKNGNVFYNNGSLGYVEVDGKNVHPLQIVAGLVRSKVMDIANTDREPITTDDAFQPFIVKDDFTAISVGQHNRNSGEVLVIRYPYKYIAEIRPQDALVKIAENIYTDNEATKLVVLREFSEQYMPENFYEHIDTFLKAKDNLIRVGKNFYYIGDKTDMSTEELTATLRGYGKDDFMCEYSVGEDGEKLHKLPAHLLVQLGKWFRENVAEISKVEHYYSYLYNEDNSVLKGRTYHIRGQLSKGYKPDVVRPNNLDEIVTWFKDKRLPEIDELIASAVASGFEVSWSGSKEYLNILNACSDFAKTQLISIPFQMCGLATSMKATDLAGLAGVGDTRISGANPHEIAQFPISIFDEAATKNKKVDAAFIDLMKTFSDGMPLRTLNAGNVNVRGHIAMIMSRVEVSELKNAHDEYLNRMNKLKIGQNTEFDLSDAPAPLEICRNAMAHYYYEKFTELIRNFELMSPQERTDWCNKNIGFEYANVRKFEKEEARLYPYQVVLSMVRSGAEQMIEAGKSDKDSKFKLGSDVADITHRYPSDTAVIASRDGRVMLTGQRHFYKYLGNGDGLKQGTKDDIEALINTLFSKSDGKSPQISYQQLHTNSQANGWRGLELDIDELFSDKKSYVDDMDYDEICGNIAKGKPDAKNWSRIAKRLITFDTTLATDVEVISEEENPWKD